MNRSVADFTKPYDTRRAPRPGLLLLDRNEGSAPSTDIVSVLSAMDPHLLRRYPDAAELEAKIADRFSVVPNRVLVTAGADDAIDRCCRAYLSPGRALVLGWPTFELIERSGVLTGCSIERVRWTDEAFPTDAFIERLDVRTGLVAIVSPNNPTGAGVGVKDFERVAEAAGDTIVLLDHAYVEYADDDLTASALRYSNVVVVRTFSKAWGLAGCRVGYALSSPDVIRTLRASGAPYPVSSPSLALAAARLDARDSALPQHVTEIKREREQLTEQLRQGGALVLTSQANFVLAQLGPRATFVRDALVAQGVLVRDFTKRAGVEGSLRITLPGEEVEFERLRHALDVVFRPEALLLDLDGVLADVKGSYRQCVIETAASFGVTVTPQELHAAIAEGNANNDWRLTQRLLEARGVDVTLDEITGRFQACYLGTRDKPGLRETERLLVERTDVELLAKRFPLAIVTGRPRAEAEWFLERESIRDHIDVVVTMEDGPLKPDPAPVRRAVAALGVTRAWMLGDTPDDVRAAVPAGVLPIGVVDSGLESARGIRALRDAGAAWVIISLAEIQELLP